MRITQLEATVELRDPKTGQVAILEMYDVEFEPIGFGCRGDGANAHSIFEIHGSVRKNSNGAVQFRDATPKPKRKALGRGKR